MRRTVLILGLSLAGCGQPPFGPQICARPATEEPLEYRQGYVDGDTYVSSDYDGDLLRFPGGAWYNVYHQLGEEPAEVRGELSFERFGNLEDASIAPAAGNQFEIKEVTSQYVTVLNGTCADYYLRVTATL